jgi:NAD(P)-dependent dehydrogenase (short-subunit alcohol dehydrogenase family)
MSLVAALRRPGPNGFGYSTTAEEVTADLDLSGRTYLLTGASSGLGLETLRVLGLRGAHVIAAARTEEKAARALALTGSAGTPVECELSEPRSVRACVRTVRSAARPLDGIIANAGIMALPELQRSYGYELQFFTNHIGHFLLVTGLVDSLADRGRVVMLSSNAHFRAPKEGIQFDNLSGDREYHPYRAYGQSKLANLLFAKELARRLPGGTQTANAVHPGVIRTSLGRHMRVPFRGLLSVMDALFFKTIAQGAATQCFAATHPSVAGTSGEYFADCAVAEPSRLARDRGLAERLWEESERIVAALPGG